MKKTTEQYEKQILQSLNKVPFEMKKIKFLLFLGSYFNKLKKKKSTLIQLGVIIYAILITILCFKK